MFKSLILAASAAFLVMADTAKAETYILVSCYRGPWTEIIWDQANPEFIQSLQDAGYGAQEAESIANYICRDPRLVDNPIALAKEVRAVMRSAPRG
ncbi:MAG: hypothetical protein AAFW87_04545 [Pseudomonadota bacterium]